MNKNHNNHKANQANHNKGTSGHNPAYQKAQDNRANQLNPNNARFQGKKQEKFMNTSEMSQDELDLWSDINNPNNDSDMDAWSDAHNPNNDDYLGDE